MPQPAPSPPSHLLLAQCDKPQGVWGTGPPVQKTLPLVHSQLANSSTPKLNVALNQNTFCFAELFPAVAEIHRWYSLSLNIVECFRKEDRESAKGRKREKRESNGWQAVKVSRAATRSLIRFAACFAFSPFRVFAILFRAAGHVVAMGMGAEHG